MNILCPWMCMYIWLLMIIFSILTRFVWHFPASFGFLFVCVCMSSECFLYSYLILLIFNNQSLYSKFFPHSFFPFSLCVCVFCCVNASIIFGYFLLHPLIFFSALFVAFVVLFFLTFTHYSDTVWKGSYEFHYYLVFFQKNSVFQIFFRLEEGPISTQFDNLITIRWWKKNMTKKKCENCKIFILFFFFLINNKILLLMLQKLE